MPTTSKVDSADILAFIEDPNDAEIVRDTFSRLDFKKSEIINGGVKEAIEALSHKRTAKYLVIDVSKSELPISDLNRLTEVCEPGVGVIVLGKKNDVGLYRDLMKLGISDYLVTPLLPEILWRALRSLAFGEEKNTAGRSKVGKIIAFAGSRGGVGVTFIATNFGSILSAEKARRTVLVDLDLHFGTVSLYCDLKQNTGLLEALQNPDRIDQIFINRLLIPVNDRYSVISSDESLSEQLTYNLEGLETLFNHLSNLFHYVLVDIPHHSDQATKEVISHADMMVLVTDPTLPGLRDTKRLIQQFGEEGTGRRVILALNKFGVYGEEEIKPNEFEETINRKINHVIHFDNETPMNCINNGKLLNNQEGTLANSLRDLVDDLLGIRKPEKPEHSFGGLLKRFKLK